MTAFQIFSAYPMSNRLFSKQCSITWNRMISSSFEHFKMKNLGEKNLDLILLTHASINSVPALRFFIPRTIMKTTKTIKTYANKTKYRNQIKIACIYNHLFSES